MGILNENGIRYIFQKIKNALNDKAEASHSHTAKDVGALPDSTTIPSSLSDLTEDSSHRTVSDIEKLTWNSKLDKNQGSENAGKIIVVDENGNAVVNNAPDFTSVTYNEKENVIEFSASPQLPGNVSIDNTLSVSGQAADAKATGDAIGKLSEEIADLKALLVDGNEVEY